MPHHSSFINTYAIKEGKLEDFRQFLKSSSMSSRQASRVRSPSQRLLNEYGTEVTFVEIHPDAAFQWSTTRGGPRACRVGIWAFLDATRHPGLRQTQ